MLPKNIHIEQIERFHDKMNELDIAIKECKGRGMKDLAGTLALQWFKLSKVWIEIDDLIEFKIKSTIDKIENERTY